MSHCGPWGRLTPRSSVAGQDPSSPASIAALPPPSAMVITCPPPGSVWLPPLSPRAPSFGSPVENATGQETSVAGNLMLCPPSEIVPLQFPPLGALAKTAFVAVKPLLEGLFQTPPPSVAPLADRVLFVMVTA